MALSGYRTVRRALLVSALGAVLCAFVGAGSASAAPITVGSPLTASFTQETFGASATVLNIALGEPATYVTSPATGTIVSWHILASGGPFFLRVLTPDGGTTYTGGASSQGEVPTSLATQTFTTDLPIKAGQTIGVDNSNDSDTIGIAAVAGSAVGIIDPPVANGATVALSASGSAEAGFNAVVQPLPTVIRVSPRSGSRLGRKVTITGTNFDGTTAVKFGSTAAKSFKVISDTRITAVAPAHHPGTVHVIVLNPGQSTPGAASKFKFKQVCVVPKLKGKTLSAARKALKTAHCKLGKVTGPTGATKVSKQKPKHGKVLPAGSKVRVTVKL